LRLDLGIERGELEAQHLALDLLRRWLDLAATLLVDGIIAGEPGRDPARLDPPDAGDRGRVDLGHAQHLAVRGVAEGRPTAGTRRRLGGHGGRAPRTVRGLA